jgi:flagellar protein FlbB
MARFGQSRSGSVGRGAALILLILVLLAGGALWFDFLGMIDVKSFMAPAYRLLGVDARSPKRFRSDSPTLLEDERRSKLEEAAILRSQEQDKRQADLDRLEAEIAQKAQDVEDRQKSLDDQAKSFNDRVKEAETRGVNVEQNARRLTAMPPEAAVKILEAMNDQDVIDVLRKVDEIAAAAGEASIVPFWMSKMDSKRAAGIQRKMTEKPQGGL